MEQYLHPHILLHEVMLNQEQSRTNKYPSNSYMFQLSIKPKHVAVSVLYIKYMPIPVAAPSKAWVCGHSLPAGAMDVRLL
jgi:hypothetical protein